MSIIVKIIKAVAFWYSVVSIIGGIIFAGCGVFMLWHDFYMPRVCSVQTTGIVVDIDSDFHEGGGEFDTTYWPVVEYTVGDNVMRQRYHLGSDTCNYIVGQKLSIGYNPQQPWEYIISGDTTAGNDFSALMFIVAGVIFFANAFIPKMCRVIRLRFTNQ